MEAFTRACHPTAFSVPRAYHCAGAPLKPEASRNPRGPISFSHHHQVAGQQEYCTGRVPCRSRGLRARAQLRAGDFQRRDSSCPVHLNVKRNSSLLLARACSDEQGTTALLGREPPFDPLRAFVEGARTCLTPNALGLEIAAIAWPSLLALAADPLASLVDTFYIAQIGPVDLAAVGVAISVFNLVSKVFNFPLLNVTTSFVAEDGEAIAAKLAKEVALRANDDAGKGSEVAVEPVEKPVLQSVSAALVLGTAIGVAEAAILALAAGPILSLMGVPLASPMRAAASKYLALRAIGAPAAVVAMATQGVFRGFKDTKTPLYSAVGGNIVNIVLDPILMFSCGFGVSGAAVATVASQYFLAGLLLWSLQRKVTLLPPRLSDLRFDRFLASGGLLLGRTVALLATMTLATSMAARQGTTAMAAHQICMQVWLAASLLSDSVALAGQTLLASAFAKGDPKKVKATTFRVLQLGFALGVVMAGLLTLGASAIPRFFTKDAHVLEAMAVIMPFVAATQPITSLAFVFDGIHYGASDFGYSAYAMIALVVPVIGVLFYSPSQFGLAGVWIGLTLLMAARMFAGFLRVGMMDGPWQILRRKALEPAEQVSASIDQ